MSQLPWAVLGIEPTDDARAIRAAYSARLKAIDPEADPQAFIALRDAFEAAKAEAAWRGEDNAAPEVEWHIESPGETVAIRPPDPPAADSAWSSAEPAAADTHARALATLLHATGESRFGLDAEEEKQALVHWRAIAADPRMQDIGHFGDIERWTSELIVTATPRSAILVVPATETFGWTAADGSIAQTPMIAEISRRYRLHQFILAAQYPGHSHHAALAELTTPAYPRSGRGRVDPLTVHELLAIVRDAWPEMEARFDANRVALWKHNTADPASPESRAARGETRPRWVWARWLVVGWWALVILGMLVRLTGAH